MVFEGALELLSSGLFFFRILHLKGASLYSSNSKKVTSPLFLNSEFECAMAFIDIYFFFSRLYLT